MMIGVDGRFRQKPTRTDKTKEYQQVSMRPAVYQQNRKSKEAVDGCQAYPGALPRYDCALGREGPCNRGLRHRRLAEADRGLAGQPDGPDRASTNASDFESERALSRSPASLRRFLASTCMLGAGRRPLAELASASDASGYRCFTSQVPFILVCTPH